MVDVSMAIDLQGSQRFETPDIEFLLNRINMGSEEDLAICVTCGTQFDVPLSSAPKTCRICADPRQFVPGEGQIWTSYAQERGKHENHFTQDEDDERIWYINTVPKLGIGERAIFIQTPHGNILWDLIAWIDEKTVEWIKTMGGLSAIVISHPHFYTTHLMWARFFSCPIITHSADMEWFNRPDADSVRRPFSAPTLEVLPGVTAIQAGGHFPGSLILHFDEALLIADTLMTVPSAHTPAEHRESNTQTFVFMYSIPNMIALSPTEVLGIWKAVKPFHFTRTYGGFTGQNVRDVTLKQRVLESMQNQVQKNGWKDSEAAILTESL